MYETINTNANSLAPDVVDAVMPHAGAMLDIARTIQERPMISKQFAESREYRIIKAKCPHRSIEVDNGITLLKKADIITTDGQVKCKLCGATILTKWDVEDFKQKLLAAKAVIDTLVLYGPDYNLGNYPNGYVGDRGIIDKMIETKSFIGTDLIKIVETFCEIGKAENTTSENRRQMGAHYRDHSSQNVTAWN